MLFSLQVGLFLCGIVLSRIFYLIVLHPLASYPGPRLAKLTNFWSGPLFHDFIRGRFFSFLKGAQNIIDAELHRRYGKFVRDGPDSLLISDIDAFKAIYGTANSIEKGDFYTILSNGKPNDPNVFAARTESLHRDAKRKLFSAAFAPKYIAQYEISVKENLYAFLSRLQEEIKVHGATLNTAPWVERFVFDTLLQVTYGSSMQLTASGEDRYGIVSSKKKMYPFTIAPSHVPWLAKTMALPAISERIRRPKYDKQGQPKGISAVGIWTRRILNDAVHDKPIAHGCILQNLLDVPSSEKNKLDQDMVRYECFNSILAGTGSTTAGLIATLYELALHPTWQATLFEDLQTYPGLNDTIPSSSSLARIDSLQAILKESLRLHPPFSGPFERTIGPGGETWLPHTKPLPRNTRVWSSLYVISRSKEVFGDDADEFRPERWLESTREMEDVWCAFGRGSRSCIGKELAWVILEMTTAAIVQRWEMSSKGGALKGKDAFEMQYEELQISFTARDG